MKKRMGLFAFLAVAVMGFLFVSVSVSYAVPSPIIGKWGVQYLGKEVNWDWWWAGNGTMEFVDGGTGMSGTGTDNFIENGNNGMENYSSSFTWSVVDNVNGTKTLTKNYVNGKVDTVSIVISDNVNVFISDGTDDSEWIDWAMGVRIDPVKIYGNIDLYGGNSGDYTASMYKHGFTGAGFTSGSFANVRVYDAAGNVAAPAISKNIDGIITTGLTGASSTYSVSADGSFTRSDIMGRGFLSGNGNVYVLTINQNPLELGAAVALKKADMVYSTAYIAGQWALSSIGDDTGLFTQFGSMTCDAAGLCNLSMKSRTADGSLIDAGNFPVTLTVAADGSISSPDLGDLAPPYAAAIGNGGNTLIMNTSFKSTTPNKREVLAGVRCTSCGDLADFGSISGNLSYTGAQIGTAYAGVWKKPITCSEFGESPYAFVQVSPFPGAYTINVPKGDYYLGAIVETNPLSGTKVTDPYAVLGGCGTATKVTVVGAEIGKDMTLVDGTPSVPNPFARKYEQWNAYSGHYEGNPNYYANFNVDDPNHYATSVSVTGPGIPTLNLTWNQSWSPNQWSYLNEYNLGTIPPATPATYTFTIVDPSGTYTKTDNINTFVNVFSTPLSPAGGANVTTNPTFTWSSVGAGYVYTAELRNQSGNRIWSMEDNQLWNYTGLSYTYNGPALTPGATYQWAIKVNDSNHDSWSMSNPATFTYQAAVAANNDIIADFGTMGVWALYNNATWININPANPEGMIVGDFDGTGSNDVVFDFGPIGVWALYNNATWTQKNTANPEGMINVNLDGGTSKNDIVFDFGTMGVWVLYNNTTWVNINAGNPEGMIPANLDGIPGSDDVVFDFGPIGVWTFYNGATWAQNNAGNPEGMITADIDGIGGTDIVFDFGTIGVWTLYNGTTWTKKNQANPEGMIAVNLDGGTADNDIMFDFGAIGVWALYNDATWTQKNAGNPDGMTVANLDGIGGADIMFDFGAIGVWALYNDATWTQKNAGNPEGMIVGNLDSTGTDDVVFDFGAIGVWALYNNTTWTQKNAGNPEGMTAVNLDGI